MEIQIPSPSVFLRTSPAPAATTNFPVKRIAVAGSNGNLPITAPVTSAPNPEDSAGIRAKQSKSRNGCLSCKKKRLKCDETKPSCVQCQKRNVVCAGYQKDYKWKTFEETRARCKPTASDKDSNSRPVALKQAANQSHDIVDGASIEDADSGTVGLRHGIMDDFRPSTTWPPSLRLASGTATHGRQVQQVAQCSSSSTQFQGLLELGKPPSSHHHTTTPNDTPPIHHEDASSGLSISEHDELFKFDASTAESSTGGTSSARSFFSHSPQSNGPSPQRDANQLPDPLEFPLPLSPLPYRLSASDVATNMNRIPEGEIDTTHAIANATSLPLPLSSTLPSPGATSTWQASRISSPSPSLASSCSSDSSDLVLRAGLPLDASSPEMLMLRFDQQTCSILSIKDGPTENPWRTLVWPLARECPALYHAISSMTAFHGAHENPMLHTPGMVHMTKSMKRLASEIENMRLDYALATSLALAFSEGWESHVSTGVQHLRAARVMITNLMIKHRQDERSGQLTSEDASRIRFLCNTFVYMDVVARLTSFEEASETDYEEILATVNAPFEDQMEVDPLMGCAMTLFPLIGRVANLIRHVYKTDSNSLNVVSTAMELKEQIEKWQVPSAMIFEQPEDPNSEVQHSVQTAEAYRLATLLYLHQAIPEIPSESPLTLAKKVLFKLASVPLSSGAIIIQIFPLFAASCEVTGPEDRSWVTQRWAAMTARLKIGNVKSCWGVVQEVWSRRDVFENEKTNRVLRRYKSRGFPGESLVPPVMEIPPNLKRKVCTIDFANEKGIVYQGNNHGKTQPQQDADTAQSAGFWDPFAGEQLAPNGWPIKRHAPTSSASGSLSSSMPTSRSSGQGLFSAFNMGHNRVRRPLGNTSSPTQLEYEYTVRGPLHWIGVMAEWRWEVFL